MRELENAKTTGDYWDSVWSRPPRMTLPSPLNLGTLNIKRLLRKHVRPGMRFLEIGCAPGKMLGWVAKALEAEVAGIDSSERGMSYVRHLFNALDIRADLRREDVHSHTFEPGSFDVVYSAGFIEHFKDPSPTVRIHAELTRPGGKVLITIPNLSGWWSVPAKLLDPEVLGMHNVEIMNLPALASLAPLDLVSNVRAHHDGRLSLQHMVSPRGIPGALWRGITHVGDMLGFLQPVTISTLAPLLVLEMTRRNATQL